MIKYFRVQDGPMGGGRVVARYVPPPAPPPAGFRRRRAPRALAPGAFAGIPAAPDFPRPDGTPGNLLWPYDETEVWGAAPGTSVSENPPPVGVLATSAPPLTGLPISVPWGESDRDWTNPTTFAVVPIQQATTVAANVAAFIPQTPVLSLNEKRNALIIQNNSTATAAGDVAPIFYVGFNAQPVVLFSLAIGVGLGVEFDTITPRDSIYVAFGAYANAGGTVVIAGAVVQGTYSPLSRPFQQ